MKILACLKCNQLFSLGIEYQECKGNHGGGKYIDNLNAEVWGDRKEIQILGFSNSSFIDALRSQINHGDQAGMMPYAGSYVHKGRDFTAFIIPESAPTVKWLIDKAALTV